jgi:hypothetical protein
MIETILSALGSLAPWWPAVAKIATIWFLGQFFKKRVWTKERAAHSVFMAGIRASLPLHPFVIGALWGLGWPSLPACEIVNSRGAAVNEGLICAFITVAGHTALEYLALHFVLRNPDSKWGVVLKVLREAVRERETSFPPPPIEVQRKLLEVKVTPQEATMSMPPTSLEEVEVPVRILPRVPPRHPGEPKAPPPKGKL